ncbi:MAG: hypothetical protein A2V86_00195 [Deltaproteobacteria bacterium RBG_16_49_23]|nr:MAG: hypothetical protein A2V86_00195 [Deltaproteobacteria bacterium RBG_16_49_23]
METLFAASLAQANRVFCPGVVNMKFAGAVGVHGGPEAAGVFGDSVIKRPVTATLSVAVKVVIGTVKELEVAGMMKLMTVGASASGSGGGTLVAFPGKLPALISVILLNVSPSESLGSIAWRAATPIPALKYAWP